MKTAYLRDTTVEKALVLIHGRLGSRARVAIVGMQTFKHLLWAVAFLVVTLVGAKWIPIHEIEGEAVDVPGLMCYEESGRGSRRQRQLLDSLNGRKLAFIGDSVSRCGFSVHESPTTAHSHLLEMLACAVCSRAAVFIHSKQVLMF